jgi:hypothetical protein
MQVIQEMFIRVNEEERYNSETGEWEKNIVYDGHTTDMSGYPGWVMVDNQRHKVIYEIPDTFNLREQQVAAVKGQMDKLRAEFQARITELTAKYNSLLAIEG